MKTNDINYELTAGGPVASYKFNINGRAFTEAIYAEYGQEIGNEFKERAYLKISHALARQTKGDSSKQ